MPHVDLIPDQCQAVMALTRQAPTLVLRKDASPSIEEPSPRSASTRQHDEGPISQGPRRRSRSAGTRSTAAWSTRRYLDPADEEVGRCEAGRAAGAGRRRRRRRRRRLPARVARLGRRVALPRGPSVGARGPRCTQPGRACSSRRSRCSPPRPRRRRTTRATSTCPTSRRGPVHVRREGRGAPAHWREEALHQLPRHGAWPWPATRGSCPRRSGAAAARMRATPPMNKQRRIVHQSKPPRVLRTHRRPTTSRCPPRRPSSAVAHPFSRAPPRSNFRRSWRTAHSKHPESRGHRRR